MDAPVFKQVAQLRLNPKVIAPTEKVRDLDYVNTLAMAFRDGGWSSEYAKVEPIAAYEYAGDYFIIDGHHRWAAAFQAGLSRVPVVVISSDDYLDNLDQFERHEIVTAMQTHTRGSRA